MSRIGRQPIKIPSGVQVTINDKQVIVKGPKGQLQLELHRNVNVKQDGEVLTVTVKNPDLKEQKALWGLSQRLITNLITGVTDGFSRQLEVNGVGYRAEVKGNKLVLAVGYSFPKEYEIPDGVEVKVEKNLITLSGIDKQLVGQVAAEVRKIRKPEPYKGKGIKYVEEVIKRKAGKTAAKGE
ncbi:MAG: 50S ribosomal protein L6 [Candidatus Buchananbacteria bacterium]|nr:50S ribosomal protein L6 [Candidatus Buchananbacteria bacterium]